MQWSRGARAASRVAVANAQPARIPRKLLQKTVAQMAVNRGDNAAQLARRVTDMYVTQTHRHAHRHTHSHTRMHTRAHTHMKSVAQMAFNRGDNAAQLAQRVTVAHRHTDTHTDSHSLTHACTTHIWIL